jgi:type IV pilus assembly protein PilW
MSTHLRHHSARYYAQGLTLIEMMVSITIGMFIVIAVVAMYAGASGAARTAEAQGRMNEDAHAALTILTQQIRMAGSNPLQPNRTAAVPRNPVFPAGSYAIRGCEGKFSNITATTAISALTCPSGTSTLPDSIAVSYEADRYNTVPTAPASGTPVPTDCVGSALSVVNTTVVVATTTLPGTANLVVSYYVADNRFYIGTSTVVTSPSLYCQGNNSGSAPQSLVENIEDMQFTYGTSPAATGTRTVAGYLDADGVETNTDTSMGTSLAGLASSPARWARVMTVRICIVARSELPVAVDAASAKYIGCDGSLVTPPADRRLRRAYHTTVVLRNQQI